MRKVFRGDRLLAVEQETIPRIGVSVDALMEAAGVAVARAVGEAAGRVLLLVGPGNNGGDALVAGRYLRLLGAEVVAYAPAGVRTEAARTNLERFQAVGGEVVQELPSAADVVVDGLLGSGSSRPLAGAMAEAVLAANRLSARRVAVDLPSGVDPGSGRVGGAAFSAHTTVALGALKPAHLFYPAAALAGEVVLHPLGIPLPPPDAWLLEAEDVPRPPWQPWHSKYERGRVRLIVGSARFPGAALLAAAGALRAGAGYVEVATERELHPLLLARLPEAILLPKEEALEGLGRVEALVLGPGLGRTEATKALLEAALATSLPLVLDADALYVAAGALSTLRPGLVLTPHRGEWERLLGEEVGAEPFPAAPLARAGAVVVQKGPVTAVLQEERVPALLKVGSDLLAQGGSGDVLAGVIGALLALGLAPYDAALTGVAWHGRAAELLARTVGPVGVGAARLAEALPEAAESLWP